MVKRLAVVLLALALVMSYAGMAAGAAKFTDTADSKHQAAIERIASLGVVQGYPDGTFKPEGTITRAEFAAVMCRVLGLEDAAKIMAGSPTSFSDVAVDHWATGYINVASSQGIINGYPDGTFKPDAQVTYAESMAMIIRALGYEPTLKGVWPVKYIAKGAELGISDGVTVAANVPAVRGDVARMVDNSLDVPKVVQIGFGDEAKYVVSGTENTTEKTLLDDNLSMTKVEGVVEDAGVLLDSDLDVKVINVKPASGSAKKYTVTDETANIRAMVGLEIEAWANDDDEIFLVTDIKDDDVKSAYVPAVLYDDTNDIYKVQFGKSDDYKTYTIKSDARVYYNHESFTLVDLEDEFAATDPGANDDYVKANYIVEDNKVVYLDIVVYDSPEIVDEVSTSRERVLLKTGGALAYGDKDVFATRDGKPIAITDLEENDVVYSWSDDDKVFLAAFSGSATGALEAASSDWSSLTVADKKYSAILNADLWVSGDKGDSFDRGDTSTLEDMLDTDVTLLLGFDGKVVAVAGEPGEAAEEGVLYGLVFGIKGTPDVVLDEEFGEIAKVYLYTISGSKVSYVVTDNTEIDGTEFDTFSGAQTAIKQGVEVSDGKVTGGLYLVKYKLDGSEFEWIKAKNIGLSDWTVTEFDDDPDRVIASEGRGSVKSSTLITSVKTSGNEVSDVDDVAWSRVEGVGELGGSEYAVAFVDDDDVVKVLVLVDVGLEATGDIAMVTGNAKVSGGWKITLDVGGTSKAFTVDPDDVTMCAYTKSNWGEAKTSSDDWKYFKAGNVVRVDVSGSGDLDGITEWLAVNAAGEGSTVPNFVYSGVAEVTSVSTSNLKLDIKVDSDHDGARDDTDTVYADDDVIVYDCTGSTAVLASFADIRRGDTVQLLKDPTDSDQLIDVIKIVSENDQANYKIMGD